MSKRRVPPNTDATNVPTALVHGELERLLVTVEDRCNHAAGIVSATARVVAGDELGLNDENVPGVYVAALEHVVGELEGLADRALKARTTKEL
jgi:hypothetical protein